MIIEVTVKTNSKKGPLLEKISSSTGNYHPRSSTPPSNQTTGNETTPSYLAYLREKPHDGEANTALIKLLSKTFHTPKTQIKLLSGQKSHQKRFEIPIYNP